MSEVDEQAARILESTADLLEHDGWTRGTWAAWGRRCLVGALNSATCTELEISRSRGPRFMRVRDQAAEHLSQVIWGYAYNHVVELTNWNDAEGRTKSEVLDVVRKAAKRALGVT